MGPKAIKDTANSRTERVLALLTEFISAGATGVVEIKFNEGAIASVFSTRREL